MMEQFAELQDKLGDKAKELNESLGELAAAASPEFEARPRLSPIARLSLSSALKWIDGPQPLELAGITP